jgi:hypothetical protein
VYVTYYGTGTLSIIDESVDKMEVSGVSIEVMIGLVIAIAAASVVLVVLFRKKQARLSKTKN